MGETFSLYAGQELRGGWRPTESAWEVARQASVAGARDAGEVEAGGGQYNVWMLVGGRGRDVNLRIDGAFFAGVDKDEPDGWQQLGKVRLARGFHTIEVVSGSGPDDAVARYAQVLITDKDSFRPPMQGVLNLQTTLMLFSPEPDAVVEGRTEVIGSAAGNISRVDFYADDKLLRRFTTPPFVFDWDVRRLKAGKHTLRMMGIGRTTEPVGMLEVEVEVKRADEGARE